MSGQAITLGGGQSYSYIITTPVSDTIFAGPGSATLGLEPPVATSAFAIVFAAAGSNLEIYGGDHGGNNVVTIEAGSAPLEVTFDRDGELSLSGVGFFGPVSAILDQPAQITVPARGATTIAGSADTVWANGSNVFFNGADIFDSEPELIGFDAGASNSTVVASASNTVLYDKAILFVGAGGVLNVLGNSSAVTLVAGAGSDTINAAGATGNDAFLAPAASASLVGGGGADTFVAGSGAATIQAGTGHDVLDLIKGLAGGSVVLQNWSGANSIGAFGYGADGVARQQVVGGSLQLTLTDQTQITLAGVATIGSGQLLFG